MPLRRAHYLHTWG